MATQLNVVGIVGSGDYPIKTAAVLRALFLPICIHIEMLGLLGLLWVLWLLWLLWVLWMLGLLEILERRAASSERNSTDARGRPLGLVWPARRLLREAPTR